MYQQIGHEEAEQLIQQEDIAIIDVRDHDSFNQGHIVGAINLTMPAMAAFCEETKRTRPILVYCYHGISSLAVAQYLVDYGFQYVYSLMGGFAVWSAHHPTSRADK